MPPFCVLPCHNMGGSGDETGVGPSFAPACGFSPFFHIGTKAWPAQCVLFYRSARLGLVVAKQVATA